MVDYLVGNETFIYSKCLKKALFCYKEQFKAAKNIVKNLRTGIYPLPKEDKGYNFKYTTNFYISKEPNDPFNTMYNLVFKTKINTFIKNLEICMRTSNLNFNFDTCNYKKELLHDLSLSIKEEYELDVLVSQRNSIFEFQVQFFLSEPETVILEKE
jgi:hypothetical protein